MVDGLGTDVTDSQISMLNQAGPTTGTIFASPGVYPYFCKNHAADMKGVIYVVEATGGAGGSN